MPRKKKSSKSNVKKDRDVLEILNCKVDSSRIDGLLNLVRKRLTISSSLFIITPNPENILGVYKDPNLQKLLQEVDYAPADGIGVAAAAVYLELDAPKTKALRLPILLIQGIYVGLLVLVRSKILERTVPITKGRTLFLDLLAIANENKQRVYLLGGKSNEAKLASEFVARKYKDISIRFAAGPMLDNLATPTTRHDMKLNLEIIREIKEFKPHMLFVAFNFPKQERWLARHLPELPVGLGMTVGGTFNFVSGKSKLPPSWLEQLGFEWLWRLITEPWRFRRIVNAVIIFPFTVFRYKLFNN